MENLGNNPSSYGLENHGLYNLRRAYWNMDPAALIEHAVQREEGHLASTGAFVALTGKYTGRSPKDKFVVREASSEKDIWWGSVNAPFSPADFDVLHARLDAYLQGRDVYVRDCFAGADPAYRLPIRIVTEYTWHNLFIRQLMIRATREEMKVHVPQFTIICAPNFQADPKADKTKSEAFIIINFAKGLVIIGGTCYAGEMKKSVFTILNYLLPHKGVLPMHCSANIGKEGDTALFFGLSGTGKTTLSADPTRGLIGDDEHGWSDNGIFNFEGGCYAKVIKLRKESEPEIWDAIRFGSVLENVSMDPNSREVNYDSSEITENTRVGYPLTFIPNAVLPSVGGHPKNVVFLSCDAFGVLPPVARLSRDQAMYHFLSGYTAKVAGTERGLKEPSATFSTCFGSPFLPMDPSVYANLLGKKIDKHKSNIWLVNTGWTGGPYGEGSRMSIAHTRALLTAALSGKLDKVAYRKDSTFGFEVPTECPGVPAGVLDPRETWRDKNAYDAKARHLAGLFTENFKKYEATAGANVIAAGPKVS